MDWINAPTLTSIAALISAVTAVIFQIIKDRRTAPIDRETAEMATATALTNASKTNVDMAMLINTKLAEENKGLGADIEHCHKRVASWERWYTDLQVGWMNIRESFSAPAGPVYEREDDQ